MTRFAALSVAAITATSMVAPLAVSAKSVSAIKGKDEKVFADSTSRCNTPEMRKLHASNVKLMNDDITKFGVKAGEQAVKDYQWKMDIIWDAMTEPYCGYGSRGVSAAKKSYQKSIARARSSFMEFAKGIVAVK